MTFLMETFAFLKKRLEIFVEKSLDLWNNSIELIVDIKNLQKFVKVAHRTMLEILVILNVYY